MTASKSAEETRADREWAQTRARLRNDASRYTFGTPESKKAWKARVAKTRSH